MCSRLYFGSSASSWAIASSFRNFAVNGSTPSKPAASTSARISGHSALPRQVTNPSAQRIFGSAAFNIEPAIVAQAVTRRKSLRLSPRFFIALPPVLSIVPDDITGAELSQGLRNTKFYNVEEAPE